MDPDEDEDEDDDDEEEEEEGVSDSEEKEEQRECEKRGGDSSGDMDMASEQHELSERRDTLSPPALGPPAGPLSRCRLGESWTCFSMASACRTPW